MSFACLDTPQVEELTERFAAAEDLTLLVGAGASMEADLPSWPQLIEDLLHTVSLERDELGDQGAREEWVERTMANGDLLGTGAVVEVMAKENLDDLIPMHLYRGLGAEGYAPGPIAHQVAHLRQCFGERLDVLTTNYDDLIERALIDSGVARSRIRHYKQYRKLKSRAAGVYPVFHLHGIAPRDEEPSDIVLTEEHYHSMQRGSSWQERAVTERLENSLCLFVGMSLSDPNLIRYLYGYEGSEERRHAAIFVRQGQEPKRERAKTPAENERRRQVRATREEAERRRWARCGVDAVFVDHFADAAQLLYEIGYRRSSEESYRPIGERASRLITDFESDVFLLGEEEAEFASRQVRLSGFLRDLLFGLLELALKGPPPKDEKFALTLWLVSKDGTEMTGWAHSDRAHQDPRTLAPIEISAASDWVAVQTVCRGTRTELDRSNYASRWHFVRGLPLTLEAPSRVPLGCLTISSDKSSAESVLNSMPASDRALLHRTLAKSAVRALMTLAGRSKEIADG